ncbi:SPW repeat domain-containing protein [Microbacterium soli]|uniref:SPW repeat protein n=1 Tax=Microbacterium soli TaxID=446075 RepID=A0ABP7NI11_9MICO
MKRWTRWQDWVAVAAGLYAALASIWTAPRTGASMSLMIVLGVLMIAAGVWSLAAPGVVWIEWVLAALGALLFLSPWFGSFAGSAGPAWTAWICGAVGAIAGLWALAPAERARHAAPGGSRAAHA